MPKIKILIVEDDSGIRKLLSVALDPEYTLVEAYSAKEGLQHALAHNPDLVLLDLGLPDFDGIEWIRNYRQWSDNPLIVISAREKEDDKVKALETGANDYLTKPFGVSELNARIKVALKTKQKIDNQVTVFSFGDVSVDPLDRVVKKGKKEIHLTPIEFSLLMLLLKNSGKVLTHKQILTQVWGAYYSGESQYLRVFIKQIREKIEDNPSMPKYILTETGIGYRFRLD